jgi:2TM domain
MLMNEHEKLVRAQGQVEAITGFYIHLVVFVLVMVLLFFINWKVLDELWWVQWPLLGWGIGVVAHALAVFGQQPRFITNWQLRKIKQLKDRM